jgi:hypothetical protein
VSQPSQTFYVSKPIVYHLIVMPWTATSTLQDILDFYQDPDNTGGNVGYTNAWAVNEDHSVSYLGSVAFNEPSGWFLSAPFVGPTMPEGPQQPGGMLSDAEFQSLYEVES